MMQRPLLWSIVVVGLAATAAAIWYWMPRATPPADMTEVQQEQELATAPNPTIEHPLPEVAAGQPPLPALDESDAAISSWLVERFGAEVADHLVPEQIIRHIVATVDNLPRERLAVKVRPVRDTAGTLQVGGTEQAPVLTTANYARYAAIVGLVQKADVSIVAAWYKRNYPLFQEAYVALGYPKGYFNDRLVQCIDNLLATPELSEPPALVRPKVFYEYADPSLESRSAGQKTLLRMGPENARAIKEKLRQLRASIAAKPRS